MDQDYIAAREQHALNMAAASTSKSARTAHRAFAKAYGLILKSRHFPHVVGAEGQRSEPERGLAAKPSDSIGFVSKRVANDAA